MTEDPRPTRLIDEVLRTHGRIIAARRGVLGDPRVTGAQSILITAVVSASEPPTAPKIARSLGYTRQAIQRLADGLADLGYIAFVDNPHHRKSKVLVLTEAGAKLHADAKSERERWSAKVTREVSAEELQQAADVLRRIRQTLEADLRKS